MIANRRKRLLLTRLPAVAAVALGVLLAASLVRIGMDRFGKPVPGPPAAAPSAVRSAPAGQPPANKIALMHLFGRAQSGNGGRAPTIAPDTRLRLTLYGVVASEEPDAAARAIIAGESGQQRAYAIGDRLPGGAELKEIYPDRIILSRQGRLETLRIPKKIINLK